MTRYRRNLAVATLRMPMTALKLGPADRPHGRHNVATLRMPMTALKLDQRCSLLSGSRRCNAQNADDGIETGDTGNAASGEVRLQRSECR